jgi:hypothetical protein
LLEHVYVDTTFLELFLVPRRADISASADMSATTVRQAAGKH